MSAFPGLLWLQAAPESSPFSMLVPMAAIFFIFYFLLIRPQQKKQRDLETMLKAIDKGDEVVTSGGLHGRVVGVADDVLTLDIGGIKGERIKVRVARGRIDRVESAAKKSEAS
jgi:preprotein translocase subunit YajC